jgi:hypothetical protein
MVTNPYEIWLTPQKHPGSGAVRLARRYVSLWKDPNDRVAGVFFFETVEGQIQGVTAFMPFKRSKPAINYVNGNRRGVLLYGR